MADSEEMRPQAFAATTDITKGELFPRERFWRDHQPWLKERGYRLRARYQPDWIASWKTDPQKIWFSCEDSLIGTFSHVLDATRADGIPVALKRIRPSDHPEEVGVGQLFSSEPLAHHQNNHCIPILDVLQVPDDDDCLILVMPFLYPWDYWPFETIGEVVDFFRQIFEGLNFMHQNHVSHRDCKSNNIMADMLPLCKSPPHPCKQRRTLNLMSRVKQRSSRTQTPIKYYLVDFGLSRLYNPEDAPHLEIGGWGGDKTVPEFQAHDDSLCDPFAMDVYCIANIVRQNFLEGRNHIRAKKGFDFMRELIADMTNDDPSARPKMDQVVSRYTDIVKGLSNWKLRSRVATVNEHPVLGVVRSVAHWSKQLRVMASRTPSIPMA
ncbi:hypothetical protein Hypma_007510 [Hypsizygus marmoreus]|uniref:Protein kinase domain-containing protein n=1 Tax=Hypsizygus marmoreus TaxID=39966 RepID=A0A369JVY4_HYPMA|nr:hypothetical protein Hypma_007510 [Hypsizygus marmoreus]